MREVSAADDGDGIGEANGGLCCQVDHPPSWQSTIGCADGQGCRDRATLVRAAFLRSLLTLRVAQLPVAAHVREVVAAELVYESNVNYHIPITPMLASLMTNSPGLVLPLSWRTAVSCGVVWTGPSHYRSSATLHSRSREKHGYTENSIAFKALLERCSEFGGLLGNFLCQVAFQEQCLVCVLLAASVRL